MVIPQKIVDEKSTLYNGIFVKKENESGSVPKGSQQNVSGWQYDMTGHAKQCVEKYLELAKQDKSTLKVVATPCLDKRQIAPED